MCVWIRQMHSTRCHMWNRHKYTKDLHAWPLLLEACQLGPKALYSPEGFIRLHHFACSYCTLSTPLVKTKQTLETTMKTPRENKLPLKVIFFPLTLDTALCFTSKNSCAGSVIRICSRWMYYSWDDIFTDLSLYVFPCMCACTSVEPAELTLSGSLTAIEGQELNLSCYTTSSNPPVDIRWWLGYKELNNTSVAMEEVGLHGTQFAQRWNSSTQSYD